jgi:UDP-N-acetylmuramoylalanine--D-glutamate ligase
MQIEQLKPARIAILGAGREGQAAYDWLRRRLPGKKLTLIAESAIDPLFAGKLNREDEVLVEPLCASRLETFDVLIRSPGVSIYREPLRKAVEAGVRLTTPSNLWFAAHPECRSICITGTKGKSTTAALLAHMLQANGVRARLAGNIGLPLLACSDECVDWWVIELSSYQIADLEASPNIAVFLNYSPEHLDWHGGERSYWEDKLRLGDLTRQGSLIVNAADIELAGHFASAPNVTWFSSFAGIHVSGDQIFDRNSLLPARIPPCLPGRHNLLNIAAALTAAGAVGLDLKAAANSIATFECLPHRLQVLGQREDITYVNDSIASTPIATIAALEALRDRPILLILGGFDRGLDWSRYAKSFGEFSPRAIIGLPESGSRIIEILRNSGLSPAAGFHEAPDLQTAVMRARTLAVGGDTILLSPGAPSFPNFADYRDRGQTFARLCGFDEPIQRGAAGDPSSRLDE